LKRPVFTFREERLTDAPFALIRDRLAAPGSVVCLAPFRPFQPLVPAGEGPDGAQGLVLAWRRRRLGAEERGTLTVTPDGRGAVLRLEGHLKGWSALLLSGWLRWRTDRLLDRFVEEL
jgi:hypothetical protein